MAVSDDARPVPVPAAPARRRSHATVLIAVALVGIAVGALLVSVLRDGGLSAVAGGDGQAIRSGHLVFRSLTPGADQGRIAYVAADDPQRARTLAEPRCLRVAATEDGAVCMRTGRNPLQPYEVVRFDDRLASRHDEVLNGVPSRARLSPDGRRYATTVFVSGHNYISLGFSTETVIYEADGKPVGNLEEFQFMINGAVDRSVDRNVWGVTFSSDANLFFVTVAAGGRTYLARGDARARTLTAVRENAECPSLSPDEQTVVYKKRVSATADQAWRFHALDLRTGREWPLGEARSVDDQVAWLDDARVMYAVPKVADGRTTADVWVAPIDGGPPGLLIPDADSPTVVGDPR